MGYDAWVLGNNDFRIPPEGGTIEEGNEQLQALIELAEFPTLCANVTMKETGEYIDNVLPYTIKEVGGLKIGIIGVISLKPQTDINIVLSHTGLAIDTKIANIDGVSAVMGADDHYIITNPIYYPGNDNFKSTPIVQNGGEQDQYLGRLDLEYELVDGTWTLKDFSGSLYDLEGVEGNEEIQSMIDEYRAQQETEAAA